MKIKMVAKSDVGKVRKINEDSCGLFEEDKLAIVCDGMGGHNAGAEASRLAVSITRYMYSFLDQNTHLKIASDLEDSKKDIAARLVSSVRLANRHIYNKARKDERLKGMGTTISALALKDSIACICHVGDSRIYRFRGKKMELLTEDHSWINELIQDNEIKKEEASQFEKKNVITRALGLAPTVKIDLTLEPIEQGDLFLLCSDGLTRGLNDDEIKSIVLTNIDNLDKAAITLIKLAKISDGSDNITASLVMVEEKNSFNKTILPSSVTLKPENKAVSSFENKILRYEFSKKGPINKIISYASLTLEKKYVKPLLITAGLLFLCLLLLFSFSRNQDEKITFTPDDAYTATALQFESKKETNTKSNSSREVIAPPNSDSLKTVITKNEKIYTRPLNRISRNRGVIYLVGLENVAGENTFIYLNNRLLGNSSNFFENGIVVRPGEYSIAIKDTSQTIIYEIPNILISSGDIKAIEVNKR